MFDPRRQGVQTPQNPQNLPQQSTPATPVEDTNFDALNQHVLLGVQAVNRLKSALLVRNS